MFSVFDGRSIVDAGVYFRCFLRIRYKTLVLCENKELTTGVIADNLDQMDFFEVSEL